MKRVVVADYLKEASVEQEILGDLARVECLEGKHEQELLTKAKDADGIILYHDMSLSAHSLGSLPKCQAVVRVGVGFDNVDLSAAGQAGIAVCNIPDYGTEDVADHALTLLLATVRRLVPTVDAVRAGRWEPNSLVGTPRLRGSTVGVMGLGRIGIAMVQRLKPLGVHIIFYDPYAPPGMDKALGIEREFGLRDFLARSEILTVHCPATPETKHILNRETLLWLPKGAYLINTGRGVCVESAGLKEALRVGHLAGVGLDVLEVEPLDEEALRNDARVIITPHVAYYSVAGFREMRSKSAQEMVRVLKGQPVRNPVNLQELKSPRCVVPTVSSYLTLPIRREL